MKTWANNSSPYTHDTFLAPAPGPPADIKCWDAMISTGFKYQKV